MKNKWKTFIQQLPVEVLFLHKDKFVKEYKLQPKLPAIFIKENDKLNLFITDKEINNCTSLQQLKDLITTQLSLHDQHHYSNI